MSEKKDYEVLEDENRRTNLVGMVLVLMIFILVLGGMIVLTLSGCSAVNEKMGLKDDNDAEEIIEKVIESKTGLDIDLTPRSPEK